MVYVVTKFSHSIAAMITAKILKLSEVKAKYGNPYWNLFSAFNPSKLVHTY